MWRSSCARTVLGHLQSQVLLCVRRQKACGACHVFTLCLKALVVSLGVVLCLKRLVEIIIDCLKAPVVLSGVTLCLKRIMELVMIYSASSVVMFGIALQLKRFVELHQVIFLLTLCL